MVAKKGKSKRQTCRQKYKIQRKIREADRKQRKEAKKNPALRSKVRKDPGIPNLWPFKDKLLADLEESKAREAEKAALAKQRKAMLAKQVKLQAKEATTTTTAAPAADEEPSWQAASNNSGKQGAYYREFQKVMEKADVILQVLDARDPLGTRAKHIERAILESGQGKRMILVLNKVDLIPKENLLQWQTYLRHEFPTVVFKANTQAQRQNLGHGRVAAEHASEGLLQSSECIGADTLIKLLKNYARNEDIKTSVTVGVIGYPNVGKSSLINSLRRAKVCGVGSTPGLTRVVQEIHLDKNIKLLDCPGIVFSPERPDASWQERAAVQLRNCMRVENLEDPLTPVELILRRAAKPSLMLLYTIPSFSSTQEFLFHIAKARGKIKKGGVPDVEAAARAVLNDWNLGKIPFYSKPPKRELGGEATVVASFGEELDLDAELQNIKTEKEMGVDFVAMESNEMEFEDVSNEFDEDMEEDADNDVDDDGSDAMSDDAMSEDGDAQEDMLVVPDLTKNHASSRASKATDAAAAASRKQVIMTEEEEALNPRTNQSRRKQLKQAKKFQAKLEAKLSKAPVEDVAMNADDADGDDNYDFGEFAWGGQA